MASNAVPKSLFRRIFEGKYAWVANTVSSSLLFMVGDFVEQRVEMKLNPEQGFDNGRLARMTAIGLILGPPHHIFYKILDKKFPGKAPKTIFQKILIDQLVACPMFSIQFFGGMALLENKTISEASDEFIRKFPRVYMVDWILWPPCQMFNFYVIPNRYRVLYVNSVTVLWNVFLSYMKHYDQEKKPKMKKAGEVTKISHREIGTPRE